MSRYLISALLLLTFASPAICAKKPVKAPAKDPTVEYFSAITKGDASRVKSLVAANPKLLKATSKDGKTGIGLAVAANSPAMVRVLAKLGASVNTKDKNGMPLLALAVKSANKDMTGALIELGASPDAILPDGSSLLHLAVSSGSADIVALLRKNGAIDDPPRLNIDISGQYQPPKMSADGKKKEPAKWIVRTEFKNADSHKWRMAPNMALFHSAGKKTFPPILTFPYQPYETLALYESLVVLWPWENFLVQTASAEANGRGRSQSYTMWDLAMAASNDLDSMSDEDFDSFDTLGSGDNKPAPPENDESVACTLTVDGKAGVWADSMLAPGQSLAAEWESITVASPDELKRVGVADGAEHDLVLVGPIVYDPDDPNAGAFLVTDHLTRPLSSSPEKFAKAQITQLTPKYIKEQIDNGPTDSWRALFVTLLWKQPRPVDNADDLLIETLQGYEKYGPLAGATAGVSLEERNCAAAADPLASIASNAKADEKMRTRIIKGLYTFDTPAVRDCLASVAADKPQPWLVRFTALNSLAKCPGCDWAVMERFKQDKTLFLQDTAKTLLDQHNKNAPDK